MSYVTERHSALILAWIEQRMTTVEFARQYPIAAKKLDELGPRILNAALTSEDPFDLEHGLLVGFQHGITRAYLTPLLNLVTASWHRQHENVISALAELRAPESVDELQRAALVRYPYLESDKTCSLGVKAITALGDIGNAAAVAQLATLLQSGQHILVKQAKKQLERIAKTATAPQLQEAVRTALGSASV
jgi:HEAT repeat protein